jgi:hypothetical protein
MPRVSLPLLLLSALIFPPLSSAKPASSGNLDILYIRENFQELVTYDIDASGNPTQVGQPFPLGQDVYTVVPAAVDHFLYVLSGGNDSPFFISVYATNPDGSPQLKPVQMLHVPDVYSLGISPNTHFAYAIRSYLNSGGFPIAQILLSYVNRKTGRLRKFSRLEYTSPPDGPCGTGWSEQGVDVSEWIQFRRLGALYRMVLHDSRFDLGVLPCF